MCLCILQCIEEVDRLHPSTFAFCHRFKEGFASVLPNVLKLAQGKSVPAKQYNDARKDALAEDLPGSHSRFVNECESRSVVTPCNL